MKRGFVPSAHAFGQRGHVRINKRWRVRAGVLAAAEQRENFLRVGLLPLCCQVAENFFDDGQLLAFVVNDEVPLISQPFDMLPENADTERMERANGRSKRLLTFLPSGPS